MALSQFKIDQAATFSALAFAGCEPRMRMGERDVQDVTKDGVPKWNVTLFVSYRDNFDRAQHDTLKVGVASQKDPGEGLATYMPVRLVNFVVGVMDRRNRDGEVTGAQVWYRADAVEPLAYPSPARKGE